MRGAAGPGGAQQPTTASRFWKTLNFLPGCGVFQSDCCNGWENDAICVRMWLPPTPSSQILSLNMPSGDARYQGCLLMLHFVAPTVAQKKKRKKVAHTAFLCVFFAERCTFGEKLLVPLTQLLEMESGIYWCSMILMRQIKYEMYWDCQNQYFLSIAWIIFNYRLFSLHLHHVSLRDDTISSYTAQHQELDDGHLLGENGTGCGSGCGWGDGQKTDKHQRSISVQLQLTSSCVRLPHNYPLLPPGYIWSETLVSDVWIDRANSHACPNGITISPMRGRMYIQKKKEETLICVAVCEKWPDNTAWKCCRMWNNNDGKTKETAAQQKSVAFKWKYGLMEFICARQWVTAEPCCAAL